MSKGTYYSGKGGLAKGDVDWINSPISALLVDLNHYSPNLLNHTSIADVPEDARIAEVQLTGRTVTPFESAPGVYDAVLRADPSTFNSVTAPDSEASAIIIFKDDRSESETVLLFFNDEPPEFPVVPDGTDIVAIWDTGDDGIYRF